MRSSTVSGSWTLGVSASSKWATWRERKVLKDFHKMQRDVVWTYLLKRNGENCPRGRYDQRSKILINDVITISFSHNPSHTDPRGCSCSPSTSTTLEYHGTLFDSRLDSSRHASIYSHQSARVGGILAPAPLGQRGTLLWREQPPAHYARVYTPITIANSFTIIVRLFGSNCPVSLLSSP